jgi:thaumarchaeosortase
MHLPQILLKKSSLTIFMIILFAAALVLLMVLDFFNLEAYAPFNFGGFYFDYSWKGRMFLFIFLAIFILEYITGGNLEKTEKPASKRKQNLAIIAALLFASIPLIYIASENFLGFDRIVIGVGEALRGDYWRAALAHNSNDPNSFGNFIAGDWILSLQYLVFAISAALAVFLLYGKVGLKTFSISIILVAGLGMVFLVDTLFPYGALKPLMLLTLPTSACATALLEAIGFIVTMSYTPQLGKPMISVYPGGEAASATVNWPCAGIHSLFLFVLIIVLLLRKSEMSSFRKAIYFIFGLAITYFVNVLRIVIYFIIYYYNGLEEATIFHNNYGELLFITWIGIYIVIILFIEKYSLVEKVTRGVHSLGIIRLRRQASSNEKTV